MNPISTVDAVDNGFKLRSHLYMPLLYINNGILPNSLHKCIWAVAHQPKSVRNGVLPWVPGLVRMTNGSLG